tara:strand:+ start:8936 stop:9115 length:180 start_codon:yes stop_codon:yes gene_type:complete
MSIIKNLKTALIIVITFISGMHSQSEAQVKVLCFHYVWPGNICELENVSESGVILTDSN